jgi:hypothetical protein
MKKAIYFNSKRFVSLILIIALFASSGILSSCSVERKNPTALTLNGIEISNDVFTYFIDVIFINFIIYYNFVIVCYIFDIIYIHN